VAYLLGSIPTGYVWARSRGIDIRTVGSGNIGATNVMRALGKPIGITVLLLDALKGFVPVMVAPAYFPELNRQVLQIVCTVAVVAGHNWTCWLRFKGGKGVATSAGALLAVVPVPLLAALAVWGVVFAVGRYVSLASIAAAVAVPVTTWWTDREFFWFTAVIGALAIYKHQANIQRLIAGTENRVGRKIADGQSPMAKGREQ
jgi:glycerol-3-phosphate acyltransferase PlsY